MATVEAILDRAGQLLSDPKRWHQGDYYSDDGEAFCSLGAIDKATWELHAGRPKSMEHVNRQFDAEDLLREVIAEHYPDVQKWCGGSQVSVANWNDAKDREHAEVVAMFEKGRALAGERGI